MTTQSTAHLNTQGQKSIKLKTHKYYFIKVLINY